MRIRRRFYALLLLASFALTLTGCPDWIHYAFMNSIPLKGDPKKNPVVHVYLAIDGLSYTSLLEAQKKGAFASPNWKTSKFITMFPGTSDASWTRILHTKRLGGYEIEYYDPVKDKIINHGIIGLLKHIMPSLSETFSFEAEYLRAFDYRADGYAHSFHAYRDTFASLGDSLDNLFFLLNGRVETATDFTAYLLQYDVLGHMREPKHITKALRILYDRIEKFKKSQPHRKILFTILADHGMDFIRVSKDKLVEFDQELKNIGIEPVDHLKGHDPKKGLIAIPIIHTRVTYLALHTHRSQVEEIAGRTSNLASVDLSVSKLIQPMYIPPGLEKLEWYGIWGEGRLILPFGFDSSKNEYYLPTYADYARLDLDPVLFQGDRNSQGPAQNWKVMTDVELFNLTKHGLYPDLFFRVRTSLAPISLKYPADVLISFRPGYVSMGFKLPGSDDIATASFHGSLQNLGSTGALITEERDLPDAVRSDQFFELFPRMKKQMGTHNIHFVDGDRHADLPIDAIK